jgi:hypothetical protein
LDGVIVGKLVRGESMMIEVGPGEHAVRVKFRLVVWSERLTLSVAEARSDLFTAKRTGLAIHRFNCLDQVRSQQ